ncbi:MAG: ABC transporter ATP-binding protein [Lachnospiraceae bacterium]|nr:ABC transporter ATP-binding protein [Lachnospiraceae bacterium]
MSKALEVNKIYKSIDNGEKKIDILKNISFSLEAGTITAVVGKSGSGKSTLLSIASGIDSPSSGSVKLLGKDYSKLTPTEQEKMRNKQIGMLFQNYHLIPELTCEENIRMPLAFSSDSPKEKWIEEWIKKVGLSQKRNLYPKQMSGGEQQRTALVRAIVNNPDIIFADEPTGALDSKLGKNMIAFLIEYAHHFKKTILLVTHDMEIASSCDAVLRIADGRLVAEE